MFSAVGFGVVLYLSRPVGGWGGVSGGRGIIDWGLGLDWVRGGE